MKLRIRLYGGHASDQKNVGTSREFAVFAEIKEDINAFAACGARNACDRLRSIKINRDVRKSKMYAKRK